MKRNFLVSLGTFDGLHRGHRKLIAMLRSDARRLGLKVLVALFAEPPRFHFQPRARASLLTTASERKSLLRRLGVDRVAVLRFDSKLASMSHERFFDEVLLRRFQAGGLVAGPDFAFGKGRKGDCDYLRRACALRGLHFRMLPPVRSGPAKISSSRIRDLLRCGKVERAAKLLGRPYAVSGRVIRGRGLGAKIGFPTANLRVEGRLLPMGVFEVLVRGMPAARRAVCNIGYRPTVEKDTPPCGPHVEVHIPGFRGNLYGKTLTIEFLRLLRYEKRFASLKALIAQIRRDITRISI
ncbi:MAG: riboflavin biosynthesis protein RibF [Elusimicrobiota bacterium]